MKASRVANIGSVLSGQDTMVFDLRSTEGMRAAILTASYNKTR